MIRVRVIGKEAAGQLDGMFRRAGNLGPPLATVGQDQIASFIKNFEVSGRPTRWAPLKASTLRMWIGRYKPGGAYRTKTGGLTRKGHRAVAGRKPLIDTGHLWRSIRVHEIKPRGISWAAGGGAVNYAGIHQFGAPRKNIPARPYLLFQEEDVAKHQTTIRDFVIGY
jgi:phage gpG-like protein